MTLESALIVIDNLKPGQHERYYCRCTTLSREHMDKNTSHDIKAEAKLLLNVRDEIEVLQYIKDSLRIIFWRLCG